MRSMTLYLRSALGANFSQIATFTLGGTNGSTDRPKAPISRIKDELTNTFGISHSTVQIEIGPCPDDQEY